jgi:hypothetical protein
MAYEVPNLPTEALAALIKAHNDTVQANVSTKFHADITSVTDRSDRTNPTRTSFTVTAGNSTNSTTAYALVNAIKAKLNVHFVDSYAHDTATSAVEATADATNTATAITLANALVTAYTAHISASNVHFNNDGTNVVTNAAATDLTTLHTLLNEVKGDVNAHITNASLGALVKLIAV